MASERYGSGRLLVTGAAGQVGHLLRPRLPGYGWRLRTADLPAALAGPGPGEEVAAVDITDPSSVAAALAGVDAVVHLAGISGEDAFDRLLDVNVAGTRNVLQGCVDVGVRRVVLASSNHAAGCYRRADAPPGGLPDDLPARPDTLYGWSKAAGEALGALYHDRYGLDVVSLRIGTCREYPADTVALPGWLSPDDCAGLVDAALRAPGPLCRVVWGLSANTRRWWSLGGMAALGFTPRDDSEAYAAELVARFGEPDPADPVHAYVGGPFRTAPVGVPMR
ncbi:NAD-dependent dehydratase [Pilimelia anulata]|uniref:NAD-dependent dehydratase n=1 Tax=Pilimelia anulata TaxID=53371 RepID=A0A8J3BC75_9ACTN|nr:NAD(P)-dependent oxidoreductase [Pilimelia anulata]GGK10311.1 NAD-dependent dehydratase [Pilimelia anulata]